MGEAMKIPAGTPPAAEPELAALRVEQAELAARVATRRSIDDVRQGAYALFGVVVTVGLSVKFAWDRWGWGPRPTRPIGRYPLLFLGSVALLLLCGSVAVLAFRRARRAMRIEDRDFARLQEIRKRLGMEA
jgi:hypothetical protein